ncbi:MAG TPA: NADH-quinone oxidoreductase subunit N [Ktedonobacterales bacterium]
MEFTFTPTATDWIRFTPELVMGAAALLVLLADLVLPARSRAWLAAVALAGVAGAAVAIGYLLAAGDHGEAFYHMVTSDLTALFASAVILAAGGLAIILSPAYIDRQGMVNQGEYYALLLLSTAGMMLMASATNLMMVFVGLEVLSLSLYILSAYIANRFQSQEAGMKYFLLSSFASGFLLYGMALTYGATGSTSLIGIRAFVRAHPVDFTSGYGPFLLAGFALMAVGFCFEVSGVPFHSWTPDVYVGAPTPITAFMSVGTKVAAFVALARVFLFALAPLVNDWTPIFWAVAILSMIVGNVLAVTQTDVKRMLAYSSVAHAGYILVGIAAGGVAGVTGVLIYLAAYCVMNIGAFGVVLALERAGGRGTTLTDYAGLARRHPALAATMAICLFALAGVPPSGGFIGKWFVFSAAILNGHLDLAIIGVVASVFGMYYYLRVVWAMYFSEPALVVAPASVAPVAPVAVVPEPVAAGVAGVPTTVGGTMLASAGPAAATASSSTATEPSARSADPESGVATALTPAAVLALAFAVIATVALGIIPGPLFQFAQQAASALLR